MNDIDIFTAIRKCDLENIHKILTTISNIDVLNGDGETPLFCAVDNVHNDYCTSHKKSIAIIESLLNSGANPNISNKEREFPIHLACGYGILKLVALLLNYNTMVEIKNEKGNTPLLLAASSDDNDHLSIVEALIQAGADINAQNDEGDTALMYPCSWNLTAMINLLISNEIDIEKKDFSGNTGLIWAVRSNSVEAAAILISAGSDSNTKNDYGLSALDYAEKSGNQKMIMTIKGGASRTVQSLC